MTTDHEAGFRNLLSAVELPPSGFTATDLVHTGRRLRRRRRQWLAAGAAGLTVLMVGSAFGVAELTGRPATGPSPDPGRQLGAAAPTPAACTVQKLALPPGASGGDVNASSPSGRYLAGLVVAEEDMGKPFRWDGTRAKPIPIDGSGEAHGVNDSGVVVGEGRTPDRRTFAWAYVDDVVVELPIPNGYRGAEATAINAAGKITGVLFDGDRLAAAVWQGPTADARVDVLDAPGGAMAFGISDSGVVVGGLHDGSSAYRWDADGRGRRLAGVAGAEGGGAHGVRGDWAYGLLPKAGKPARSDAEPTPSGGLSVDWNIAVVWDLRTGQPQAVDDGRVEAITPTGQMVVNHPDDTTSIRAVDGTLRALPPVSAGSRAYGYALADDGVQAAGTSAGKPVRWSCAPAKASR